MEDKSFGNGRSEKSDNNGERVGAKNGDDMEFAVGEVIWVKFADSSWWPAVVVDDDAVSRSYKPDERSMRDVLVRLYGSSEYLYVDPAEFRSESEFMLKQNEGCFRTTFRGILEQELHHSENDQLKGRGSKSKASKGVKDGAKEQLKLDSQQEQRKTHQKAKLQNGKIDSPTYEVPVGGSLRLTPRRIKVMQTLGLAAPCGSPFLKDEDSYATF